MPRTSASPTSPARAPVEVYSGAARGFHWTVAALVLLQLPLGLYMVYRGEVTKFDATTGTLYDTHKLVGVVILLLMLARLFYRLSHGAPADEPTIEPWQKVVSHVTHWLLYALLIIVAIGGYLGVSYYGAAAPFGIQLPVFVAKDQKTAEAIFALHKLGGLTILALVGMHIGAALFHHVIRKDNVLRRMAGTPK